MHIHRVSRIDRGAAPILFLLLLILVSIIAFIGWYVWSINDMKLSTAVESTSNPVSENAYVRTTDIPTDWVTYTNDTYKFSWKHPKNWEVTTSIIPKSSGSQNKFSNNANEVIVVGMFNEEGVKHRGWHIAQINIQKQTLEDTASQYRSLVMNTKLSEKKMTIDGHPAVEFRMKYNDNPIQRAYLIYAHGYTFVHPEVFEDRSLNDDLSAEESLRLFEAFKIHP